MDLRVLLAALAAGWAVLAWMANRSAFFPMPHPQGEWEEQARLGAQDVWLESGGTRVHGWWRAAPGAQSAVLFLHGNAGNVTHRAGAMEDLNAAGASILVIDYRGYGKSGGSPSEEGLYQDADAGYDWLRRKGWGEDRIILAGESLGTAVAVDLAARRRCAGVVLEAPFPSARAVAARVLPVIGPLLVWGFDSASKIAAVRAPLLFIHGDRDEVIGYDLGRKLFAAAPEPKKFWTVPGAHHNDLHLVNPPAYRAQLREFMMNACSAAASSPPLS